MGKRTWSEEDLKVLYDNFPEGGIYKCMELLPHKTRKQIKGKIDALKIKSNHYDKWTEEENALFKEAWENYSMEKLLATFPNRTYQKMMLHAGVLGYHSKINRLRKCDLTFLDLNNMTPQSSYWWGFIMADGHISKRGQLIIQLKDVDKDHLEKFAVHVNGNVKNTKDGFVRVACNDKPRAEEWFKTFQMTETAKTYFPPNLEVFEENFIYFFIGFTDGDGCIWLCKNYPLLKIELHKSWLDNLTWFSKILKEKYDINSKVKLSKKGTAQITIENRWDILKISEYCKDVEYLERKWDKILNYVPTINRKNNIKS